MPSDAATTTPNHQLPTPKESFRGLAFGIVPATNMEPADWIPKKPFDLRERLLDFACLIVQLVQFLHTRGDGSSDRDTAKRKIVLRELKETRFRLVVLHRSKFIRAEHEPLIQESSELIRIVATLIRNG